ncbi:hypothetical protein CANCADRAFT_83936 [Tortispora caseinolytica NRRL Y-17796]|uniref:C2H2-type domain-containing protein n=1 Tax=Tortispora caseinolytica NRRL Y-17796 TaxID=767744 RepID=A0A1E4TKN1_9ASCO|nr:hypothetical protein CANCADRAFT_83936 [Tortispora caseinolytica NRRL Y-17796]
MDFRSLYGGLMDQFYTNSDKPLDHNEQLHEHSADEPPGTAPKAKKRRVGSNKGKARLPDSDKYEGAMALLNLVDGSRPADTTNSEEDGSRYIGEAIIDLGPPKPDSNNLTGPWMDSSKQLDASLIDPKMRQVQFSTDISLERAAQAQDQTVDPLIRADGTIAPIDPHPNNGGRMVPLPASTHKNLVRIPQNGFGKFTAADSKADISSRPHACPYPGCAWRFTRPSDQRRHLRSHYMPALQCPFWRVHQNCHRNGGAFNRLDVLKRHLKLVHYAQWSNTEEGSCRICEQRFENVKSFIEHCATCPKVLEADRQREAEEEAENQARGNEVGANPNTIQSGSLNLQS